MLALCTLLIVNILLDFDISRHLRHSRGIVYNNWNKIIYDTINADLLVLGSSRAVNHYNPLIMDSILCLNTYNLGLTASNVSRQMVRYQVYRHYQRKKPLFLIITFDYWGMWNESNAEIAYQYYPYMTKLFMRDLIIKQEHFDKSVLYIPMYRYYIQGFPSILKEVGKKWTSDKGYKPILKKWDGTEYAKIDSRKFMPEQNHIDRFDLFLNEIIEDGVKVVLVSPPIYTGLSNKVVNLSEFYEFRQHVSDKYNIPVLDYFNDPICNDTNYFYNESHLNKTGAELFTTKLCHDLDSLGIIK